MTLSDWQSNDIAVVDGVTDAALSTLPIDNLAFAVFTGVKENTDWHNQRERSHNHVNLPVSNTEHWNLVNQSGQVRNHSPSLTLVAPHGRPGNKGRLFRNVNSTGLTSENIGGSSRRADNESAMSCGTILASGQRA